jgi:hypothetical protein
MPRTNLLALLTGGDRRSIGNSHRVCALVLADTTLLAPLVRHMRASDPVVCMRAADALEKISVKRASLLQPFTPGLLGLADETVQPEVRWHLALMLPRLQLNRQQRLRVFARLREYLGYRSSIVKTAALQGLLDLAGEDRVLVQEAQGYLELALRAGTPAMKARARKLLSARRVRFVCASRVT